MTVNKPAQPSKDPRAVAVRLMTEVTDHQRLLSELLPEAVSDLPPADRARAGRLATEALRWSGRADRVLGPFLRMKPEDGVLNVLRLAIWEIYGDNAAPHGVVDRAVAVARQVSPSKAGLVNAVLRNVLRAEIDWDALPAPSLPKWLRKPLLRDYGKTVVEAIEAAHARGAPLDLTTRQGRGAAVAAALGGAMLATGSVRCRSAGQISALPGYFEGDWWVQDAAAAIPARLLGDVAGQRVLDLCAAPGGKTLQLADAGAAVTAVDVSRKRLERLHENLTRTGLSAEVVAADVFDWAPEAAFDAVLVDAPCSATGTIRRHPDLPHAKAGLDIGPLVDLQARLIDRALGFLRPGGRLVFCTCSLLHAEGEAQLDAALARHPALRVLAPQVPGVDPGWLTPAGGLRLRPDFWPVTGGMDGFFAACVQQPA